jgi:transcriptional regulator with XRE-family HTH domain
METPMRPNHLPGPATAASGLPAREAGAIVRAARQAAGLTLAELGQRCGYSASQVSRYERGIQPLTDIRLLHRLARALAIPPQALGLVPPPSPERHAGAASRGCTTRVGGPNVNSEIQPEGGEDPVRRRELLSHAAGLAGAAALGVSVSGRVGALADPGRGLEGLLYGSAAAEPVSVRTLRAAAKQARSCFQTARYDRLAAGLPGLIATATATRDSTAGDERATASTLLAESYIVAAGFLVKLNDDAFAWTLSDRALLAAQAGNDPLTLADGRRAVATVLRRTGRPAQARSLLDRAARDIEPGASATPDQLSMYGTLLEVAAYTAAVDGNRSAATELVGEARRTATRLGHDANHRHTAFGPANVTLYQVSIAQVLGDNGTAIEHARTLRPAAIPTAERQGRYWIDVARAFHQWGKPENCYRALLAAERAAPAEVRYRPPVHRITEDLLRAGHRHALPGLHAFAGRIGLPGSGNPA